MNLAFIPFFNNLFAIDLDFVIFFNICPCNPLVLFNIFPCNPLVLFNIFPCNPLALVYFFELDLSVMFLISHFLLLIKTTFEDLPSTLHFLELAVNFMFQVITFIFKVFSRCFSNLSFEILSLISILSTIPIAYFFPSRDRFWVFYFFQHETSGVPRSFFCTRIQSSLSFPCMPSK